MIVLLVPVLPIINSNLEEERKKMNTKACVMAPFTLMIGFLCHWALSETCSMLVMCVGPLCHFGEALCIYLPTDQLFGKLTTACTGNLPEPGPSKGCAWRTLSLISTLPLWQSMPWRIAFTGCFLLRTPTIPLLNILTITLILQIIWRVMYFVCVSMTGVLEQTLFRQERASLLFLI